MVNVATRLFAEPGFDGTPVELVTEAAGVVTTMLYALNAAPPSGHP
ncbi:TetR family transcriptional regulator [Actinomadura luteofluorescens]